MERRFNSFLDGLLSGDVVVSVTEQKALGPSLGRGSSFDRFDPNAWDGDGDGLVQEGTLFERPAIPGVNTDLPNVPKVPQVPVSNNKEVRIYDEISGSSRSMRAGINTARFPKLKRRGKINRDLDIPQIIKEKTGTVDDGEASKLLAIKLANLERQLNEGRITYGEYNSQRIISLVEYRRDRSLEQSETKAAFEIPREISGIGETGEDGNVIGFVNLIRFSSMHNGIRYLHSDDPSKMGLGPLVDSRGDGPEVAKRYPAELRLEEIRTLESMNQEFEEYLQQLRDGSGWEFPLTVSIGFSFIEKKEFDSSQQPEDAITSEEFTNHLYLENDEIPKYLAGIAYSLEQALGKGYEGKIDIATADRIAKLLSKSWAVKQQYRDSFKDSKTAPEEMYDINMRDIFSPEGETDIPYFMPLGLGESGKYPDVIFEFPFDKDGADIPVVIKRGIRIHRQETMRPAGPVVKKITNYYFFDTHQPEVLVTGMLIKKDEAIDGRREPRGLDVWEFSPNTENPNLQVGKIESPKLNNSPFSSPLARPRIEGSTASMDLQAFPFRITKDGIPYRFEPSFSVDEQPAIKRINEFLKEIGIPETKASETDSLYVPSEFDPRYLVVNGPLETPGKNEQRPKSYLDKLREAAAVYENTDPDLKKLKQIDGRMAQALLRKQSVRRTGDEETIYAWEPEELVADNASIDALQREPQTPSSTAPPKQDMAQKIRERKIRKNLGLSDDEEIPPEYGGDSSRSKRDSNITPFDLGRPEELEPDLEYYVDESNGFPTLRHPLVYAVPYMSSMNALYNRQYLGKKDQLADASDTGDWHGYVYLHERPYRLDALLEISDEVDDATFWSLLSGIWMDSENIPENQELWNEIFDSGRAGMENMMRNDEREALAALPQKIKIYQGHTGDRDDGWSWTTDKSVALWFAQRFSQLEGSDAQVTEATADKNDVLAYLLGRGESEILVSPEDVVIDVTESAEDFQDRTDTDNTYGDRSLSRRVDSLAVDSLTATEFIDDFRQNDDDSSKLAENLGLSSSEPVDRRLRDLVNLGLIEDVSPFDSSRSKRSDDKKADKERALQRFMSLTDDEVVALFKEHDGSGTNVRVSLGNPNEKEFYARIEEMKKRGVKIPERGAKEKATFAKMSDKELLGLIDSNNGDREKTRRQLGLTSSVFYSRIQAMKKDSGDDSDSSRSKKEVYSFTPESDIAEQIRDRKEVKKKASKEIVRVTPSTRKREEIREITSRIEEKVKSLSDITDSSALSELEDEIDALSIELQSILNNITSVIPTNRGRFKPYVSVYGRTAFGEELSSSYFEIRFDYLTESAEPGSWPGRTMYGDLFVDANGEMFIRKSVSRDNSFDRSFTIETIHEDTEHYFDAFQDSIFSAMGVKKFRREATSPKGIVYSSLDGLDWADEVSKSEFIKAIEWISEKDIIKMSDSNRAKLKELIAKARKEKLGSKNGVTPRDLLEGYDAVDAVRAYQRAEFEARTDDAYMRIDFTGDIISPDDTSGDGYYFGGDSSRSRRAISPERRKKLTTEASKLSARYSPSTRQREEIRTKMDEVRNNVKYYKENPRELEDFIHDIFTRDLIPDGDSEEQFIVNLDGKDYELYFGTHVDFDTAYGKLEIRLVRIPEGAVDEESVLKPGIYRILIDDDGNMTAMKDMAETGDKVPSLVTLRGEGDVENFVKLNKAMNLIEESILSAMGIESFEQNATAYRGESGNMRRGISLSLAEGRTFADEEGKEIFLKIIESIAKNVEIDSDTRERLKTLHDRAKKEQLNKRNAVQPEDFLEDGLNEKYDLEKGIRDYLDDEKNGMQMLSIDFVKKIDSPDSYYFGGDSSRSKRENKLTPVKTTFKPDKRIIFTGDDETLDDDLELVEDEDELFRSEEGDAYDVIAWEERHPDVGVYISKGKLHGTDQEVHTINVRYKFNDDKSNSQGVFVSVEITEDMFNELSLIMDNGNEIPKSISDSLNKSFTKYMKEVEDLARVAPRIGFQSLAHLHFATSKLTGQNGDVVGFALGHTGLSRQFLAIKIEQQNNLLRMIMGGGRSPIIETLTHEFGHALDKPIPEIETRPDEVDRLGKLREEAMAKGDMDEFLRINRMILAVLKSKREKIESNSEEWKSAVAEDAKHITRRQRAFNSLRAKGVIFELNHAMKLNYVESSNSVTKYGGTHPSEDFAESISLYFLDLINEGLYVYSRNDEDGEPRDELKTIGFQYLFPNRHKFLVEYMKRIEDGDSFFGTGDSSRSKRDSSTPEGFISPEEFKSEKERAAREYGRYAPSSGKMREFERITKEISAMLAELKDDDDEKEILDGELLKEFQDLLQSSFGKYLYGDEVIELEFTKIGAFITIDNRLMIPIVATGVSPSLGKGYLSNRRLMRFGTMYIDGNGDISFSAKDGHGHITDSMGDIGAYGATGVESPGAIYREFMNINNRSKQLARDEVFTENIIKAAGAKSARKYFTSNRYFPQYSGEGDGLYGDGITFAAEQDYYWADEFEKTKFLDLIQEIIDSVENTSKLDRETKKRLKELVDRSRKEKFGKPNTIRPKDLIQGYNSRDEIFWIKNTVTTVGTPTNRGRVSIAFAVDVTSTSDDSYYFGGDSSRSMKMRGRDAASLTPEERRRIRERAERNTAMRLPSTRQREEMNSIANKISELQKMGTEEDRAFGVFIDEDMRNKVEDATRELGELIEESIIGKMTINGQPVKLEVSLRKYRPIMDESIEQDVVMFIKSDDDKKSTLLSRRFAVIFKEDGSISIRKNDDGGDSIIDNGELGSPKDQVMRTELSAALQNIEKNIASAIGAETMTARHYSNANRDEFGNVVIDANGASFAADNDFDWATEKDKEKFLEIIEWSANWLSAVSSGGWDVISETKSNELKNLVEKSRKEKFGKQNTIRPKDFSKAINLSELEARYSIRRGRFISIDFTEKVDSPYFYGGDSSRSSRSIRWVPDVAARKEIRKKVERDMARHAPSPRETQKIRDISERLRELAKKGPGEASYGKEISAAYLELIDALNINKKININGEDVEIEIKEIFLNYDTISLNRGITMSVMVDSKLPNGNLDGVELTLSIDVDGKINAFKNLRTASWDSIWSGRGPYPVDRREPGGYSVPDESVAREAVPRNIIFRKSIDSMINNLVLAFGADTVDMRMSEGDRSIQISTGVEDGMTWATEKDKADFLALIKWANSSPVRHFSTTRKLESDEELFREMAELVELIKKAEAQPFGKSNAIGPQELLEKLNHNEAFYDAATNPHEGLSTTVTLTEKIKSPNSDSYYFGDSSRSKRSSEIANSDAPAPTKKQIQAIGELQNVVSDGRKDYRLFSDEEKSIPKQIFDGKIKIGEEEYSSAIDTSNLFVSQLTNGSVEKTFKFSGKVLDKDGNEVASFSRGINFLDGKPVSVTHDGLYIKRVGQGLGVATALNARNEKLYKELGIPKVVVNASTSGDGKVRGITHWLRNGYSWDDSASRNKVLKIIDKALQDSIIKDKEQESAVREIRESIRKNLSNLNDDINLESLANWDGADEWFSSMAKEEENQMLNVKLKKNLIIEPSSRSKRTDSAIDEKYTKVSNRINESKSLMQAMELDIVRIKDEQEMDDLRAIWDKTKKEVNALKKEMKDIGGEDEKEFKEEYKNFNDASRMIDKALDVNYLSPYERSRGWKTQSQVEHFAIHDKNFIGGVASVRWNPEDKTVIVDFMGSVPLLAHKGIGAALYGEILKWGKSKGAETYIAGALPGSQSFWQEMGMTPATSNTASFRMADLIPMEYRDDEINMIDELK